MALRPCWRLYLTSTRLAQDVDAIEADAVQSDTQAAVETLQSLQSQLEDVGIQTHMTGDALN